MCYQLDGGKSWDRALKLHRATWPLAPLELEIFRPLSMLFNKADIEGFTLDSKFEKEFMNMLTQRWGDPESVQEGIKASFWAAFNNQTLRGVTIPALDQERVLSGMINFYRQSGGKVLLPEPMCQWKV
jgi:hypothetical protein